MDSRNEITVLRNGKRNIFLQWRKVKTDGFMIQCKTFHVKRVKTTQTHGKFVTARNEINETATVDPKMNTGVSKFKYQHLSIKLNWLQFIRDEITVRTIIIIKKTVANNQGNIDSNNDDNKI